MCVCGEGPFTGMDSIQISQDGENELLFKRPGRLSLPQHLPAAALLGLFTQPLALSSRRVL